MSDISYYGSTVPAERAFAITPNDSADLARATRGVMVSGAGNLNVILKLDSSAVVIAVSANVLYPLQIKRVLSTSTTATGIVGLA
jgi:hypothetical protein